ncbi:hypothetical protein SAMN02910456_00608 [Ruminococcaceae bacterium YRB3002]|nr:hypothetical protein SAMN02910456_00608 [Ruminococcaceae bacterium YRB3002]
MKKKLCLIITSLIIAMIFTPGCAWAKNIPAPQTTSQTTEQPVTYRYVLPFKADSVSEDALGDIRTNGDYRSYNPDNMLCYMGYYQAEDFVTLVFGEDSPIELRNVELFVSENLTVPRTVDGILYREEDHKKYITFKFETTYIRSPYGPRLWDAVGVWRNFQLPTKESENKSYYYIVTERNGNPDYPYSGAGIGECIQTDVIEQSYWTDYRFNRISEWYSAEEDAWRHEYEEDLITDYMPLE